LEVIEKIKTVESLESAEKAQGIQKSEPSTIQIKESSSEQELPITASHAKVNDVNLTDAIPVKQPLPIHNTQIDKPPVTAQKSLERNKSLDRNTRQNPAQAPSIPIKQTISKLVQFRIDQACLFTKNETNILLTSAPEADIIRELVICSLDFCEKNMPILSLLLHCPTQHLKTLYENLKTDEQKKLSIHIFRQLQSDLQPKIFE